MPKGIMPTGSWRLLSPCMWSFFMAVDSTILTICTSCRSEGRARDDADGKAMLDAVRAVAHGGSFPDIIVRGAQCLSVCKRVCTASVSGHDRYTFVIGDLSDAHAADLLAFARQCHAAPHGFVAWKERPEPVRKGIVARVAPPGWSAG